MENLGDLQLIELSQENGIKSFEWSNKKGKYYILPRNLENGIYFDTLLMVPNELNQSTRIALTTRNTGSTTEKTALKDGQKIQNLTEEEMKVFYPKHTVALEAIYEQVEPQNEILVYPLIIQRYAGPYYQQLTREAIEDETEGFQRVDLQILKAVDKIREIFLEKGIHIPQEMDLLGQSSAGAFAQRFCLLHLDRVRSCCTNGSKDAIPLPISSLKGKELNYPLGTADYEQITGKPFDLEKMKQILFMTTFGIKEDEVPLNGVRDDSGDLVSNYDMVNVRACMLEKEAMLYAGTMGKTQAERMLNTARIYESSGICFPILGFMNYGHGQRDGSYEAAKQTISSENVYETVDELQKKYQIINIGELLKDPKLAEGFIHASENSIVKEIREQDAALNAYLVGKYGNQPVPRNEPEKARRVTILNGLEDEYLKGLEPFIATSNNKNRSNQSSLSRLEEEQTQLNSVLADRRKEYEQMKNYQQMENPGTGKDTYE